jgi:hypothetical protein
MKAGRGLDALVAEKVMGGFVNDPDAMADVGEVWYWLHPKDGVLCGMPYKVGIMKKWDHQWDAWKPSTDIAAAWQVAENLNKRQWRVEIAYTVKSGVDVEVTKWENDSYGGEFAEWGGTAPHAICLAALKALEVEV